MILVRPRGKERKGRDEETRVEVIQEGYQHEKRNKRDQAHRKKKKERKKARKEKNQVDGRKENVLVGSTEVS